MPLYDYHCDICGDFDAWRTMADVTTPMPCPDCHTPAKRLFSAPHINLSTGTLARYSREPRLVKPDRAPAPPKYSSQTGGRPWMINH